jgi:hypothetical protein
MRTTLGALLIIVGLSVSVSAQSVFHVDMTDGVLFRASMKPLTLPYATGVPWASVPSHPLTPDVTPTVTHFRIRTWLEGEGVRVIVFGVQQAAIRPGDDDREVQIASVLVPAGQSVVIDETRKYNARPVTVTARPVRQK